MARSADGAAVPEAGPAREVVLLDMPVSLRISAREHHDTLMREFTLHEQTAQATPGQAPPRLVAADRGRSLVLVALPAAGAGPSVDLRLG